jgi:hypothetical protein
MRRWNLNNYKIIKKTDIGIAFITMKAKKHVTDLHKQNGVYKLK